MWGSRWNRFAICFRSKVISTSGFHFRFRDRHLNFRCRLMSSNVGSAKFGSCRLENVGVAVGIASPSVSVQKLFPLPVPWPTFWFLDARPISDNVGSVIFQSGVVENVASAYRIASLCLSIQKLCVHACLASAILKFACRSTCHVTNFTHLWVFSSPVLCGQLF